MNLLQWIKLEQINVKCYDLLARSTCHLCRLGAPGSEHLSPVQRHLAALSCEWPLASAIQYDTRVVCVSAVVLPWLFSRFISINKTYCFVAQ